jgi:hypothetical protein
MDRQRLAVLVQAAESLPPRCLEVFILRKIEHLRVEEIVLRLGVSRKKVEKHLRRVLLECQGQSSELRTVQSACEHAAEWTLRVDAGGSSELEWWELERWLSADSAHRAAFEEAYGLWVELDEVAREVDSRAYARNVLVRSRKLGTGWRGVAARLRLLGRRWFGGARTVCDESGR